MRVVVAAPPGGLTDIVARSVSQFLHEKLGQPFVIENIAGASNTIGTIGVTRRTSSTTCIRYAFAASSAAVGASESVAVAVARRWRTSGCSVNRTIVATNCA